MPGVVVTRVSLAPRFMRELIDAMADNYSRWETREGIRDLPEASGSESGPSTAGGQGGYHDPPPQPPSG